MKPYELLAQLTPARTEEIFSYLLANDKAFYKATIESLAQQRKLRAVFVLRKTPAERHAWLREALSKKAGSAICAHVFQAWLVGAHSALLCDFLDSLGIKHEANGTVDSLPPPPEKDALRKAADTLLEKHDRELVAIYLNCFVTLEETGWTVLDELLVEDGRLHLTAATPTEPSPTPGG